MSPILEPARPKKKVKLSVSEGQPEQAQSRHEPAKAIAMPRPQFDPLASLDQTVTAFVKAHKTTTKHDDPMNDLISRVKSTLSAAQPSNFPSIYEADKSLRSRGVYVPLSPGVPNYPPTPQDRHIELQCDNDIVLAPPEEMEIAWRRNGGPVNQRDPNVIADLFVQMPSAFFGPKDYLEFRYLRKRALYIGYITATLANNYDNYSYRFEFLDGDELRPVLLVENPNAMCILRVVPAISTTLFPLGKLAPSTCRARRDLGLPTPQYNASIVADAYHIENARFIQRTARSIHAYEDSIVLGKVWLSQRHFSGNILEGGFGDHEWALLQCHLLQVNGGQGLDGGASNQPSVFQLFINVLEVLAKTNSLLPSSDGSSTRSHRSASLPTLIRGSTPFNLFYKMCNWSYSALKHDAVATLSITGAGLSLKSQFIKIFSEAGICGLSGADIVAWLPVTNELTAEVAKDAPACWNVVHATCDHIYGLLRKGYGNRSRRMSFSVQKQPIFKVDDCSYDQKLLNYRPYKLQVSITLDEQHGRSMTERGPDVEDAAECSRFREFWRGKAELRRFKDGRVSETVTWEPGSPAVEQITKFLYRQLPGCMSAPDEPSFYGSGLESLMVPWYPTGPASAFDEATAEFDSLCNTIRGLQDFPLHVSAIRGTSPELRFASLSPPAPCSERSGCRMEAEIEFESSSNWPTDPEQRKRSELGLLLKLSSDLMRTNKLATAKVGLQSDRDGHAHQVVLDAYFSSVVRLVKKWFESHYLSSYFLDEIMEACGSAAFKERSTLAAPGSVLGGFRRALFELSQWDWRHRPFEIETLALFTDEGRQTMLDEFESRRQLRVGSFNVCAWIAIAYPDEATGWLACVIPRVVAARMTQLARRTCDAIFRTDTESFDFTIHLKASPTNGGVRKYSNVLAFSKNSNLECAKEKFISELETLMGHEILFFPSWDNSTIGGLWKPLKASTTSAIPIGSTRGLGATKNKGDPLNLLYNKSVLLESIKMLGEGCIDYLYVNGRRNPVA
ncbi:hypothetical protein ABW19_dt0201969 [Dactylella cylindrospora]|nr:hypothetical protein ABW19_dt0201969 [Dactylella cylindrospora]